MKKIFFLSLVVFCFFVLSGVGCKNEGNVMTFESPAHSADIIPK